MDPLWEGVDLRCRHFSPKMYVKIKELGPIGGACAGHASLDPPMCIHVSIHFILIRSHKLYIIQCTFIINIAL